MKYIMIDFEDEKFWIEIGEDNYAMRQIIRDNNNIYHLSCIEDCLGEGPIVEQDLDGDIKFITKYDFEGIWDNLKSEYGDKWKRIKLNKRIGSKITGTYKYSYPQGYIFDIGDWLGVVKDISKKEMNFTTGDKIKGIIIGYDDINMWFIIKLA